MSRRINTSRSLVTGIAVEARTKGLTLTEYHGDCSAPVYHHLFGYPDEVCVRLGIEPDRPVAQEMTVRCRKCPDCLRHRARLWAARAADEIKVSQRTWFATLTLRPDRALQARYAAHARLDEPQGRCNDEGKLFAEMARFVAPELTLFLKRIRKNSSAKLRYLLVCEAHKSGIPHWHALIHENGSDPVTKRQLDEAWRWGFAKFKLIDGDESTAPYYVSKYLSKSALTRVRASKSYGDCKERLTERIATPLLLVAGNVACPTKGAKSDRNEEGSEKRPSPRKKRVSLL